MLITAATACCISWAQRCAESVFADRNRVQRCPKVIQRVPPQDLEADLPWCKASVSRPKSFSKPPLCVPNVCVCPNAFAKLAEISHYPSLHSRHMVFVPSFGNACRVSPSLYPHGANVCRSDSDHDYACSGCSVCVCFLFVLFALEQPQFKNSPRDPLICHAAVPQQSLISSSRLSTSDSELSDDEATCRIKNDSSVKLYSSPVGKPYRMECQVKKPCSACPKFRVHMYLFYPILLLPTCQVRVCRFYVSLLLLFLCRARTLCQMSDIVR